MSSMDLPHLKLTRPLFTLPLPDIVVSALAKSGYQFCEELFEGDTEYQQKALDILKPFNLNFDDIRVLMKGPNSVTAAQLLRNEQMTEYIPTFSEALDKILGGGVEVGSILQVCGPPGSGKTQIGLQLCVNAHLPCSLGGLEAESVFIDTESSFNVLRFREIATSAITHCIKVATKHNLKDDLSNFTVDSVLSGVHYVEAGNILQFMAAVEQLRELIKNNEKIKCIVIDSFTFPFLRISNHLDRTRFISNTIQKLRLLAENHNIAVLFTNHLTTKINQESKILVPSLGGGLSHSTPNIMLLGKVGDTFSAFMYKSNRLPEEVVPFKICSEGVRDV